MQHKIKLVDVLKEILGVNAGEIKLSFELPAIEAVRYKFPTGEPLDKPYYCHSIYHVGIGFETMQKLDKEMYGSILVEQETKDMRKYKYSYNAILLEGKETDKIVEAIYKDITTKE